MHVWLYECPILKKINVKRIKKYLFLKLRPYVTLGSEIKKIKTAIADRVKKGDKTG